MKQQMVRTVGAAASRRRRNAPARAAELQALTIDRARTFDGDVLGVDGKNEADIAVV